MCRLYSSVPWLVVTKIEICKLRNSWSNFSLESLLQIAANVKIIEKRLKARSTQFVIKFETSSLMSKLYSYVPWLVETKIQIHTIRNFRSNFKFGNVITNCGKCENHRKSPKGKANAVCNEGSKTSSLMSILSCSVPWLVVTMTQVIYFELPTVACVWKLYYKLRQMWKYKCIDKRPKPRSPQSVIKFEKFILNL